jgi:hypothetical protein
MASKKTIKQLREGCDCSNTKYCPLEILLLAQGDRLLLQHKLVEIYKFSESKIDNRDIGWDEAYKRWVNKGYAEIFSKVYEDTPELDIKEMYKKVIYI